MRATGLLDVPSVLPAELEGLRRLALNLRWSWRAETRALFARISTDTWAETRDPGAVLRRTSASRWRELVADDRFRADLDDEVAALDEYVSTGAWFQDTHDPDSTGTSSSAPLVAYFSMEFGITPSLPLYSGGLGVLAGDHLKSASDLGVPLLGVGLLYRDGYFSQSLTTDGWQHETYTPHDPSQLPITPVIGLEGGQLTVHVSFPEGRTVEAAVWEASVGRVPLLLLDTNREATPGELRMLTDRLYGGDEEHRIGQELILGIGGLRAVHAYCEAKGIPAPPVTHLNEGHAGFLGLERLRLGMERGLSFDAALAEARAASIFTTHTPVPAGIDRFDLDLVRRYLDPTDEGTSRLVPGVPVERCIDLGREAAPTRFNMAHLGLRLAQRSNGVAKLHGAVSREMFADLYGDFPSEESPIGSVTNGVHMSTWVSPPMRPLIKKMVGDTPLAVADTWEHPERVSDEELWTARTLLRRRLVTAARQSARASLAERGREDAELGWVDRILDPSVLTVGFARRVSTYKRLTLMLRDPDRLRALLLSDKHPVQFVVAGKAHPADHGGKQLMQQLVAFADDAGVRHRITFLTDYDMDIAQSLVAGSDVWLNNPIRPQEASGTSGMKAVMNGSLTLSVSDGWWDEMADDALGWTIPTVETEDHERRDYLESQALYDLLEHSIAPEFYDRDGDGLPRRWLQRVRASLVGLAPAVSATRMVRDYVEGYYRPAQGGHLRFTENPEASAAFAAWSERVKEAWPSVSVDQVLVDEQPVSEGPVQLSAPGLETPEARISADVAVGQCDPSELAVEVFTGPVTEAGDFIGAPLRIRLRRESAPKEGVERYSAVVSCDAPGRRGLLVRVTPQHACLVSPAEVGLLTLG